MEEDLHSVSEALQGLDSRTRLVIELWDDRAGFEKPEFLGQVQWNHLPIDAVSDVQDKQVMTLQSNPTRKKAAPRIQGSISAGFKWRPSSLKDPKFVQGSLEVLVHSAEGICQSDWKKGGLRDIFAVVHCWPRPPDNMEESGWDSSKHTTDTIRSLDPVWEESASFDYCWPSDWKPDMKTGRSEDFIRSISSTSNPSANCGSEGSGARTQLTRRNSGVVGAIGVNAPKAE